MIRIFVPADAMAFALSADRVAAALNAISAESRPIATVPAGD